MKLKMNYEEIEEFLPQRFSSLTEFWEKAYPADIAEFLLNLPISKKKYILENLTLEQLSDTIRDLNYETNNYIARYYSAEELQELLSNMYPDDAVDFMATMPIGKSKIILSRLKEKKANELQRLLGYEDESAGGLMNTDYIAFYEDNTVKQVLNKLRELISEPEMIYYIYVISRTKELLGVLSVRQILTYDPQTKLRDIMNKNVIKVHLNMDQEEVANILSKYDLLAVPVVNKQEILMGIITVDDAIDVIEEEATEDMYKMNITSDIYEVKGGIIKAIKKRLPWLLILLIGDLLSGSVIRGFEASLQAVVTLAIFIPVLMDMGGNVGTQSLTVVVRGLATGDLHDSNFWSHLWNEIKVGLIMAVVLGSLLSAIVFLWQGNPSLGFIVGISMFSTMVTAIILGTSIPYILNQLGADPAVAAGPFITTLVDISGLFIYFTLATILIKKLI